MILSPEVSAWMERTRGPLPADGQLIRADLRDGTVIAGTVSLVWLAMDEPCIDVQTAEGKRRVYPGLGDRWEPVEPRRPA